MGIRRAGQRHRHRSAVLRAHLHGVPAAAQQGRVPGHGHRARHLQEGGRAPRRQNLGGVAARRRCHFSFHAAEAAGKLARGRKMTVERNGPIDILLVEDNPGDERLTREALKEGKVYSNLHWVKDGVEALEFLRRQGKYAGSPRPDIILLDLNLPKKDGREVLSEIKRDDQLKRIPVVILTTSKAQEDVMRTYNLHANCYVTKPVDLEKFIVVVKSIDIFWLTVVTLPPNGTDA